MGLFCLGHYDLQSFTVFVYNFADELLGYSSLVLKTFYEVVSSHWTSVVVSPVSYAYLEGYARPGSSVCEAKVVKSITLGSN